MNLLAILQPSKPPEPKNARVVRLGISEPIPVTTEAHRARSIASWNRRKDAINALRRAQRLG